MEEKLRKKKLLLRLLGGAIVFICIALIFVPLFEMTKTVEVLGVEETISAKFSIWQMIVQDEKIALESSSALGEFKEFASISMEQLLGEEKIALFTTGALIALAIPFVIYAIAVLLSSLLDGLQQGAVKYFLFSYLIFSIFPIFVQVISGDEFTMTVPVIFILIIAVLMFGIMSLFDKLFSDISAISAEIFIRKYKNEDKKWFDTFLTDIMVYMDNANISTDFEGFVRFIDAQDRKELRKKTNKKEILLEDELDEEDEE